VGRWQRWLGEKANGQQGSLETDRCVFVFCCNIRLSSVNDTHPLSQSFSQAPAINWIVRFDYQTDRYPVDYNHHPRLGRQTMKVSFEFVCLFSPHSVPFQYDVMSFNLYVYMLVYDRRSSIVQFNLAFNDEIIFQINFIFCLYLISSLTQVRWLMGSWSRFRRSSKRSILWSNNKKELKQL